MRQFVMSVVERRERFSGAFATQPFEAAWAGEAIVFIRVEEIDEGASLAVFVQLSADGVRWVDEGTRLEAMSEAGDYFVRVSHFGGWLRLRGEVGDGERGAVVTVQLALKE